MTRDAKAYQLMSRASTAAVTGDYVWAAMLFDEAASWYSPRRPLFVHLLHVQATMYRLREAERRRCSTTHPS